MPGKVFAHVLLARLQLLLDSNKRPSQSGFMRGRSAIDAIHLLSKLHVKFTLPLTWCMSISSQHSTAWTDGHYGERSEEKVYQT